MKPDRLPEDNLPESALDLLKMVSAKFSSLEKDKKDALYGDMRDVHRYQEILIERTNLIANLPNYLSQLKERNIEVSEKIKENASKFSAVANEILKSGSATRMNNLLIPSGSRKTDKNELEQLIEDLESSQTGK